MAHVAQGYVVALCDELVDFPDLAQLLTAEGEGILDRSQPI